jgi:putative membrane protein
VNKNFKTALIIGGILLAVIIVVPLVVGAIWGRPDGEWGMMWPGMMIGFGWMWLMPIFWVVLLGLIIWAIVAAVRSYEGSKRSDSSKPDSALETLKQRYARGEISKEEYEEKRKDLA